MGSPLGAAKYNYLLQGAASLDRLGTTGLKKQTLRNSIEPMASSSSVYGQCSLPHYDGSDASTQVKEKQAAIRVMRQRAMQINITFHYTNK